jgi:hypothetical protein
VSNEVGREETEAIVRRLDTDSERLSSRIRQLDMDSWRSAVGDELDAMLSNPDAAAARLSHPDARFRVTAISVLDRFFDRCEELRGRWEQMADEDTDPAVRQRALLALVKLSRGTNDALACRLLAQMVNDKTLTADARMAYYEYLLTVAGGEAAVQAEAPNHEINWDFVDRILHR